MIRKFGAYAPLASAALYLFGSVFSGAIAQAQSPALTPPPTTLVSGTAVAGLLCNLATWLFWFVIIISVIMALWAAFTYVTASDDAEKTSKARKILTYSALGVVVALLAVGFPTIVSTLFPESMTTQIKLSTVCTSFSGG